ncbi:Superfamily II DNA or RNA helicase, SNF2 family [Agromyces sp. CF514]|uniref:DEAD/DEAH box helicase n=1 Tax=Agromyces sp. CF514 TaxID=1881031 RepID=UPI0008EF9D19|nr:DEAD/DEAH box helicase [Agromyces sp. CF514]SFR83796.1 Superfamily II DNA or RNA helicase, SNF2 family [Agromyces sp. CF514]
MTDQPPPAAAKAVGDWRSVLGTTLGGRDVDSGSTGARDPRLRAAGPPASKRLGLQFELRRRVQRRSGQWQGPRDEPAKRANSVDRLAVRPVTQGARGAWIKSGLTWQNIAYQGEAGGFDPAQARWFAQFALLKGSSPSVFTTYGSEWVTLDEFESPLLWALFAEAGRLGIALVGSDVTPDVVVHGAAAIALDVHEAADGGLTLTPELALDGLAPGPLVDVRAVGTHGVYRFDFDDGCLELAPFSTPPTDAARALLEAPATVRVPSADVPEFLRAFPALERSVAITSRDDSFTPPPPVPTTLVLDLRFEPRDVLRLAWRWEHADGRTTQVGAASPNDGGSRERGEREALAATIAAAAADPDLDDDLLGRVADVLGWVPLDTVLIRGVDAAEFVAERLPKLEALATRHPLRIDVEGERPDYRLLTEPPKVRVTTVESRKTDWFDLGVVITIDGKTVPFMPLFRALAQGKRRLLLVDKSYLMLNQPIFDPLRDLIEEAGTLDEWQTGVRIHASRTSLWSDFEDLAHEAEPAVSWRETVAALEHGRVEELPEPAALALPLRPYQLAGFRWLAYLWANRLGGILADDMGLGKTAQTLALIAHSREVGAPGAAAPFLVVAPTSVASNWVREAARFTPGLRVASVTATQAKRRGSIADAAADADLVVTTYAVLRLEAEAFGALEWGGLVLDEAQFVKNAATKVHAAARGIRAPFRLAVTGTPIENDLGELWAILQLVAPGLFPSRRRFDEQYRRPIELDRNLERRDRLRRRIRPLMLRRTKEQVEPELPAKQEQVLEVALAPTHRRLYDTMLQRERQKLLGLIDDLDRNRFIVYRSLTLLRMLALDATLIDDEAYASVPSAKLDALFEQLDDVLAEGHRALVFSQFTSFLDRARSRLDAAGVPYAYLDGSTPVRRRDGEIARFRSGEASVFLISLKAGGFGLNLTEADYVFLLDPWWNPASEAQAIDRAHRIGQTKQVMVYRLVAADTIEQKVMALKARKGELVASILDEGTDAADPRAAEALTADDLRGLLEA